MAEPWDQFVPNPVFRHQYLSGVEISQPQATQTVGASELVYTEFFLPTDVARGGTFVPDITGVAVCVTADDTLPFPPFFINVLLEFNQFGDWTQLARGSYQFGPPRAGKVWVTVYFDEPIPLTLEQTAIELRLGIQTDNLLWQNAAGETAFRLLTNSADSGVDFLGNRYRGYVRRNSINKADTLGSANTNSAWLSKPNPSKFAVEPLYFDVSDGLGHAKVTDRMLIDPITPGMYATLYYSSEGDPGQTEEQWEDKLWQPIFDNFKIDRRLDIPLPEPITAKFIKVEFTHLQAQSYQPGTFHQPVVYRKHPKWVLAYFLARINTQVNSEDPILARRVRVVYDALQLGYDYYLDDLDPQIEVPATIEDAGTFFADQTDKSDLLDAETLSRVWTEMKPYAQQPGVRANALGSLLSRYVSETISPVYPTETIHIQRADTTAVSSADRMPVLIEQNMPVMFFYLTCRHMYRMVSAEFENDKAYFAGVREIAFTREHYTAASDQGMYVENSGDFTNVLRNDFIDQEYIPFEANPAPVT